MTKFCFLPYSILQRARPIFAYSDLEIHQAIGKRARLTAMIISTSPKKHRVLGIEGWHSKQRPRRPNTDEDSTVAEAINLTL